MLKKHSTSWHGTQLTLFFFFFLVHKHKHADCIKRYDGRAKNKFTFRFLSPWNNLRLSSPGKEREGTTWCLFVDEPDLCNWDRVKRTCKCHQTQPVKSSDLGHHVQTRRLCYTATLFLGLSLLHCTERVIQHSDRGPSRTSITSMWIIRLFCILISQEFDMLNFMSGDKNNKTVIKHDPL